MVKSDRPLQIRLTEPVVFLRGPSTGLDFRGRPQVVRQDGQPAMLRGLLTLRLSKPTRIRSITVRLDGKARTEWPEGEYSLGIGPRRMDTHEEHEIINESTTFFSAKRESASRSRSARRAASLGPSLSLPRWDLDDEDVDDDLELLGVPGENDGLDEWTSIRRRGDGERGRGRGSQPPRSASALPGLHDGTSWHRDGFSRRPSFGEDSDRTSSGEFFATRNPSLCNRGPSPAYMPTPEPFRHVPSGLSENPSGILAAAPALPSRDHRLSPIVSAAPSRAASDRDDSTETERRFPALEGMRRTSSRVVLENDGISQTPEEDVDNLADILQQNLVMRAPARSILGVPGEAPPRHSMGEVRFADPDPEQASGDRMATDADLSSSPEPEQRDTLVTAVRSNRAASIRTMDSTHSGSTTSLSHSSHEHTGELSHPVSAAVKPISAVSTAHNSPAPSAAPSIRARPSTETLPASRSVSSPSPASSAMELDALGGPSASSSLRSSLLATATSRASATQSGTSATPSTNSSTNDLTEVRQGRKSRLGSASTIVINNGPGSLSSASSTHRPSLGPGSRLPSDSSHSQRSASGPFSLHNRPSLQDLRDKREPSVDDRGRKGSKFSLSAALRGLSQDVKDRVSHRRSSKSHSRQPSVMSSHTRTPSITEGMPNGSVNMSRTGSGSSSAIPSHLDRGQQTSRTGSLSQDQNFVPPYGRGGAGRINTSRERSVGQRERTASPARMRDGDRSDSWGRGRNKGMKVLTGALGLDNQGEEEDVHNWKEFRKGTYNYPISFPIPVDAPPTIHAEFGSVVYRLKATVVRVGALTPNLVEELEVTMIATPQEDDLEETENVIVERQWEEQMRYQIALSGKAFPIGGTIPMSVRLMPLMKCKVHRLTVALEEKTDYFAQGRKVARHETPKRFLMLFIKQPEKKERIEPLLPIISIDSDAARDSPLAPLAKQAAVNNPTEFSTLSAQDCEDEMYAQLLDPLGPWHLEKDLQVPDCAHKLKFTSKHDKTNLSVSHWLKVTIRVERGDDVAVDAKGRRKQFDIIIETPIKILDCRVNPQWNSLPTYSMVNHASLSTAPGICSVHGGKAIVPVDRAPRSSTIAETPVIAGTPLVRPSPIPALVEREREGSASRSRDRRERDFGPGHGHGHGHEEDTLLDRNIVYDRLMSGQETEMGEVPPTYGEALASAARTASRGGKQRGRAAVTVAAREGSQSRSRSRLGRD